MKFTVDAPVFNKTNQVADILGAGFLWLICSVPVVTIGPATAALYYTVVKVVRRNRETVVKSFFHSFKNNLGQGIILTILYLLYGAAIGLYILAALEGRIQMNPYIICTLGIILACPFLFTIVYIFPVISRFQAGLIRQSQYALYMSIRHFPSTIALLVLLAFTAVLIYFVPFLMAILPGFYAYLGSFFIERIFKKYLAEEIKKYKDPTDLPWYLE